MKKQKEKPNRYIDAYEEEIHLRRKADRDGASFDCS